MHHMHSINRTGIVDRNWEKPYLKTAILKGMRFHGSIQVKFIMLSGYYVSNWTTRDYKMVNQLKSRTAATQTTIWPAIISITLKQ